MTNLLIMCKDCRHEVWMTPREYIKWRCPLCNGYPAVRESRRDKVTEFRGSQKPALSEHSELCTPLQDSDAAVVREAVCQTAG